MLKPPIALEAKSSKNSSLEFLLGVELWNNGPYIGLYRGSGYYVLCAVVDQDNYVCGKYRTLALALRDYRDAVSQWIKWAERNGLRNIAERLKKHLASLEAERLVATL